MTDKREDKDHDLILEAVTILRGLEKNFDEHKSEDNRHFANLYRETKALRWYIGIGLGLAMTVRIIFGK